MAYTPIGWQTGDTITAEKMNKMDNGWGVSSTQLFSESVTTTDQSGTNLGSLAYNTLIDYESIVVTFGGTDYTCPRIDAFGEYFYGGFTQSGPDFSVFPFFIEASTQGNNLVTQTAGTYTVTVTATTVAVGDNFSTAVRKVFVLPIFITQDGQNFTCNMTFSEIKEAIISGGCCYALRGSSVFLLTLCSDTTIVFAQTQVSSTSVGSVALVYSNDGSISTETVVYQ